MTSYRVEYGTAQRQQALAIADELKNITLNVSGGSSGVTPPSNSTVVQRASSTSSTTLLAARSDRRAAMIFNDSTAILFLKLGTGASSTSYTAKLYQDAYYEVPGGYTGAIAGAWSSSNGFAYCTEVF